MVDQLAPTPAAEAARDILDDPERLARLYREGVQQEVKNYLTNGRNVY